MQTQFTLLYKTFESLNSLQISSTHTLVIHFYFWITIIAFLFFISLPLFLFLPRAKQPSSDPPAELKKLSFSVHILEQAFYQVKKLFGAIAYDVCLLGRQCITSLSFIP